MGDSSPLPATRMQALPEGADEKTALYHELFAADIQAWWQGEGQGEAAPAGAE